MFLNQPNELIEQRLAVLPLLSSAACHAHAAINSSADPSAPEVLDITEDVSTMARQALLHQGDVCTGGSCNFHTRMDQLINRADRLLREDREKAMRALQAGGRGAQITPSQNNEAYGNIATVESFVGVVKSLAYYSLSAALHCSATPKPAEA